MLTKDNILNALRTNKQKLRKFGIRNVGLFGSHINNEQSSESDIDLLIDFEPEKENFDNFMAVYDLFDQHNHYFVFFLPCICNRWTLVIQRIT